MSHWSVNARSSRELSALRIIDRAKVDGFTRGAEHVADDVGQDNVETLSVARRPVSVVCDAGRSVVARRSVDRRVHLKIADTHRYGQMDGVRRICGSGRH